MSISVEIKWVSSRLETVMKSCHRRSNERVNLVSKNRNNQIWLCGQILMFNFRELTFLAFVWRAEPPRRFEREPSYKKLCFKIPCHPRVPFDIPKWTIEFYKTYKYDEARYQVRTFRELFSPFARFSFPSPAFFPLRLPRATSKAGGRRARKRRQFLVARFTTSKYRANERGASRSFLNPNRWKIDGDADEECPLHLFCRPSVHPSSGNGRSFTRARARARG